MAKIIKTFVLIVILILLSAAVYAENEVWTYCNAGGPLPRLRSGHSAIHDEGGNRMIIFGGMSDEYGYELGDMWAMDDSSFNWTELTTENAGPPGLRDHAAIYDPDTRSMVFFGGVYNSGQITNDIWILDIGRLVWRQIRPDSLVWPDPRFNVYGIYWQHACEMVIFAGRDFGNRLNDLWAFNLITFRWRQIPYAGYWPSDREGPPMVLIGPDTFLIFGGYDPGHSHYNDVWTFDLVSNQWTQYQPPNPLPPGRRRSSLIYDKTNDRVLIYGGMRDNSIPALGDLWQLDLTTLHYTELTPTGDIPSARGYHSTIAGFGCLPEDDFGGHKMVVFAGANYATGQIFNDTYFLDWEGTNAIDEDIQKPSNFVTLNSYPNPFNATTSLDFVLAEPQPVELKIYNISGQLIEELYNGNLAAGAHTFRWNANNYSSGIYLTRLVAGENEVINKLVLLK